MPLSVIYRYSCSNGDIDMQMDILDSYGNCKMELVVEWQQSNYDYSYPYRQVQKLNPFVVMVHSLERGSS